MTLDGRIRLVVTDIDGTLLDSAGRISEEALAMLKRVASGGATVSLATSRRWVGARTVAEELGLDCPLILYDGAITRQCSSGETLASHPLQRDAAREAVAALVSHGLRPIAQYNGPGGESMLTISADPETDYAARFVERFQAQIQIAPLDALTQGQDTLLRVVAFAPHGILLDMASSFADARLGTQLLEMGGYETAELTFFAPGASKGAALLALAERLGIPAAETFAIGDGLNDISMLKAAGVSVAMAGAPPSVRAAARFVTSSNDEEGFARALAMYVLPRIVQ
ncbi:MAG TPA: HAD family hydrolase [Ktedonobacterales bacterium]|nr:HAD family hydrolase [Ktedonobacterales bacterium]